MQTIGVVGGGPSGMMAAISSKIHNPNMRVMLFESTSSLGNKLLLTGGGRCNVTADVNNDDVVKNIVKNGKFLYSALQQFGPKEICLFFEEHGCPLQVEDHHRVFPMSNSARDIVDVLKQKLIELDIDIFYNSKVIDVDVSGRILYTENKTYELDFVIYATGGKTYPQTGSDGSGYSFIRTMGHTVTPLKPAEVPLVSNDACIQSKELQGLSFCDVVLSVYYKGKVKRTIQHDLLFTHFGLSGPAALRASFDVLQYLEKDTNVLLTIDFLPDISYSEVEYAVKNEAWEHLDKRKLPKRLCKYIEMTAATNSDIARLIKKFPIHIYTTRGFSNAFVTNGGIQLREVEPKTMKSKIKEGISFCGELLDMNAYTGGYNITIAFASGYVAGKNITCK